MNRCAPGVGAVLAVVVGAGLVAAQAPSATAPTPTTVDGLVSAAKAAAGTDWPGTFLRLCIPPPPTTGRGRGAAAANADGDAGGAGRGAAGRGAAPATPDPRIWHAEPAKVADNFYFLGTKIHSAWALVGSDGIIVFEALFDYAAPDEIVDGMRKLGLDTSKVKYIVISHAHGDHDGGAYFLQDKMKDAHLIYGGPDWDAVEQRTGTKPKKDMVGEDGMTLSVGDASVKLVTMPGHTAGTLSFLFTIRDNGRPIRVAYVGGTAIPFNGDANYYDLYIASSKKMAKAAADYGATALVTNHTEFDNAYYKAHTAANRKPGDPDNPLETGATSVARYFTMIQDCAMAAKLRAVGRL